MAAILHAPFSSVKHPVYHTLGTALYAHRMTTDEPSYTRLLLAAKRLKGWDSAASVAKGLTMGGVKVSDQIVTNWRTRGVAQKAILDASRVIGCRPLWLRDGTGIMEDAGNLSDDEDLLEAISLISSVRGRLRTKAVGILEREIRTLRADEDAKQTNAKSSQ